MEVLLSCSSASTAVSIFYFFFFFFFFFFFVVGKEENRSIDFCVGLHLRLGIVLRLVLFHVGVPFTGPTKLPLRQWLLPEPLS
jgi:hypothetical protein